MSLTWCHRQAATRTVGATRVGWGPVRVRSQVVGYVKKQSFTDSQLGEFSLELPPCVAAGRAALRSFRARCRAADARRRSYTYETQGVWWELPPGVCSALADLGRAQEASGSLAGVANASVTTPPRDWRP